MVILLMIKLDDGYYDVNAIDLRRLLFDLALLSLATPLFH